MSTPEVTDAPVSVSWTIIAKDCPDALANCVDSLHKTKALREGDQVVVVDTGLEKMSDFLDATLRCLGIKLTHLHRPDLVRDFTPHIENWIPQHLEAFQKHYPDPNLLWSFAEAREVSRRAAVNEVCFWIDTDDILTGDGEGLRKAIDKFMNPEDPKADALFLDYRYSFDADGTCNTILRRERAFFRDRYHWLGRCHETAVPQQDLDPAPRATAYVADLKAAVDHTDFRKDLGVSDLRNYIILRDEYEETGATTDARTVFYLGNAARGLRLLNESDRHYDRFDSISGSPDDRFAALYYRATMRLDPAIQRPLEAVDLFQRCVDLQPENPLGYFGISRAYASLFRYNQALWWYEAGRRIPMPEHTPASFDPTHVNYHPHVIAAYCAREIGNVQLAREAAQRAVQARPQCEDNKVICQNIEAFSMGTQLRGALETVLGCMTHGGPHAVEVGKRLIDEFPTAPKELEDVGLGRTEDPDPREPRPNLSIFCGPTPEEWGPANRENGIGGSEKMVILLAPLLQEHGPWNVTVYCNVPREQRGVHGDNVRWCHWSEFDADVPRDTIIYWRSPQGVTLPHRARQRIVWNHDVQDPAAYNDVTLPLIDKVICLSKYHAEPLRGVVPDEKLVISRNAIEWYMTKDVPNRNPKQVVFASSPDRGLVTALEIIERAQKIDPEIVPVVAYGFSPFARKRFAQQQHLHVPDLGRDMSMDLYERRVYEMLDRTGATMLNRVGFEELAGVFLGSGVWLYPTRFPEISCMTAMEAQAAGLVPVTTRFAALDETLAPRTVNSQFELPALPTNGEAHDAWIERAAYALAAACQVGPEAPCRRAKARHAWKRFNAKALAQSWVELFRPDPE